MENWTLLFDSAYGVYIPQAACESLPLENVSLEDISICLAGPEHKDYWEVWEDILNNATITLPGGRYTLYQDNDLWAVPEDFAWDTFEG